ncbi:MAG: sodium:solute symporter family protein [Candidatus Atribacteria bacterium]|nr:sodium:solute symporter family protein [Candidatus Atribacteria bacterium]
MKTELIWIAIIVYMVWGTLIAFLSHRGSSKGVVDYFLADRKLKGYISSLSYSATTYSAFMLLGLAGLTYKGGVGALGFELIYLSGLFWAVLFGPFYWRAGKHYNCVSPAELLSTRYQNKKVGALSAWISLIFLIPYSSIQLMGIGYLLDTLSNGKIPFLWGALLTTIITLVWIEIAGLRSVATTDSLQAGVMLISSIIFIFILIGKFLGGFNNFLYQIEKNYPLWLSVPGNGYFSFQTFLGLSLPWFFFSISNPQVSQRLFVPSSLSKMRSMISGFLGYGLVYTLITILIGFCALLLFPGLSNPDQATPTLLAQLNIPPMIVLLMIIGIFSAAISTIDSVMLTISSMFVRDIVRARREIPEKQQLAIARWFILILGFGIYLFAIQRFNLIAILSVASSAGLLATVPSTIGGFLWTKGSAFGALTSMLGGAGISLFLQFSSWKPWGLWPGVWTMIIATLLYIVMSYAKPAAINQEFFKVIQSQPKNT